MKDDATFLLLPGDSIFILLSLSVVESKGGVRDGTGVMGKEMNI